MLPNTSGLSLNACRGETTTDASFPQRLVNPVETLEDERPLAVAVARSIQKYKDVLKELLNVRESALNTTIRRSWEAVLRAAEQVKLASPETRQAAQAQLYEVKNRAVRNMQRVNRNAEMEIRQIGLRETYLTFASSLPVAYRIQMGAELVSQAWKFFSKSLFIYGTDTLDVVRTDDGVQFAVNFMDAVESHRHIGTGWGSPADLVAWSQAFGEQQVPRGWKTEYVGPFESIVDPDPGSAIVRLTPLAAAYLELSGKGGEAIFSLKTTLLMNFKEQFEEQTRRIRAENDAEAVAFVSNLPYSYRIPDNDRYRFRESVMNDSIIPMLKEARAAGLVHGDLFAFSPDTEALVRQRQPFAVGMEQPDLHRSEFAAPRR